MTEEKNENEELKELFSDFTHKIIDKAIEYRSKFESIQCVWVISDLFKRDEESVTKWLEDIGDKDLIQDWKKLKKDLLK